MFGSDPGFDAGSEMGTQDIHAARILDDTAVNDMDTDDNGEENKLSQAERTAAFLTDLLKDGPMDSNAVKRAVQASEFSMTTINRIKDS